jgi:hypothetical protein
LGAKCRDREKSLANDTGAQTALIWTYWITFDRKTLHVVCTFLSTGIFPWWFFALNHIFSLQSSLSYEYHLCTFYKTNFKQF